jgi:hypothetical protein
MIRQPGYLSNLGFFKKIQSSDKFVYLDDAQFEIRGWDNRNKIKTKNGETWLTVPVIHPYKKKLNEIEISYEKDWQQNHVNLIEANYKKTPFYNEFSQKLFSILEKKWTKLIDLNMSLIDFVNVVLDIKTPTLRSSTLNVTSSGSQLLLDICKSINAQIYMSGIMGKNYLDEELFKKNNIEILYENFQHPEYRQMFSDFLPNMSIIDLIFNEGQNSLNILKNSQN